jgi:predicted nucleic acid-binding protein
MPLGREASALAAAHRLRGADAAYGAVAKLHDTVLVTLDRQQLERLPAAIRTCRPAEALQRMAGAAGEP